MRRAPRRVLGPRDVVRGLQPSDDHGDNRDTTPSRPSSSALASLSPSSPFWDLEVTDLAWPLPLTAVRREGDSLPPDGWPGLLALTPLDKARDPQRQGSEAVAEGQEEGALGLHSDCSCHAPLGLAHDTLFRPQHKGFPLPCPALPWVTPMHQAGQCRS